jgi:hypothetical protein
MRTPFLLHPLGFLEEGSRLVPTAERVEGGGNGCPGDHALEGIAALVGELDALLGRNEGLAHVATSLEKLAEVGGASGGLLPILERDISGQRHL